MIIDCDTCTARGPACGDCVVTVLLGAPSTWDADEQKAIGVLADSGLVPPLRLVPLVPEAPVARPAGTSQVPRVDRDGPSVNKDTPPQNRRVV